MKKFIEISLLVPLLLLSCNNSSIKDDPMLRLKYINKKYMFSLQFHEKWINYLDFEKTEIIDPQIIIPVIYFALPTRSREWQPVNTPAGYAELFRVRIFTKPVWKLYEERFKGSDEFKQNDRFPGEGKDFVYMIMYPDSIPVDLYIFMKESVSITGTFRILFK